MTRQQCVDLLNRRDLQIVYNFYIEKCEELNFKPSAPRQFQVEYHNWTMIFGDKSTIDVMQHYIKKFDIRELSLNGKLIKYI